MNFWFQDRYLFSMSHGPTLFYHLLYSFYIQIFIRDFLLLYHTLFNFIFNSFACLSLEFVIGPKLDCAIQLAILWFWDYNLFELSWFLWLNAIILGNRDFDFLVVYCNICGWNFLFWLWFGVKLDTYRRPIIIFFEFVLFGDTWILCSIRRYEGYSFYFLWVRFFSNFEVLLRVYWHIFFVFLFLNAFLFFNICTF